MSNGNSQTTAAEAATSASAKVKTDTAEKPRYVVLVDNHTHEKIKRELGEVIEFPNDTIPKRYPKVFALEGTAEATKAIATAKAAKQKVEDEAKAEADRVEAAKAEEAAAATKH